MSALFQFLQRNRITQANPLPLVHSTESYHLKRIVSSGKIEARPCNVFVGEKLSYFFVGRAAYKRELNQDAEYWELPSCVVLGFSVNGAKRVYPFDSGAFVSKRYPPFVNMMDIEQFETGGDSAAVHKIIGTFFSTPQNYYRLNARPKEQFEALFDVDVLDEDIKALHKLIQVKDKKFDDRRFAIEVQFSEDVNLLKTRPICFILPETYLANQQYVDKILSYGAELISYPIYPLRKEFFYYAIYEKLDNFYKTHGLYNV